MLLVANVNADIVVRPEPAEERDDGVVDQVKVVYGVTSHNFLREAHSEHYKPFVVIQLGLVCEQRLIDLKQCFALVEFHLIVIHAA